MPSNLPPMFGLPPMDPEAVEAHMPMPPAPVVPPAPSPMVPPALPMPSFAPQVQAPQSNPKRELAMLIPALLAGLKDPGAIGAALRGMSKARDRKYAQYENELQKQERKSRESAEFYARAMEHANQIEDEADFERWRQMVGPSADLHGIDPRLFTFNKDKATEKKRKSLVAQLEAMEKRDPSLAQREDFSVASPDYGEPVHVSIVRGWRAEPVDAKGKRIVPPVTTQERDTAVVGGRLVDAQTGEIIVDAAPSDDQEWVIRGGVVTPIAKGARRIGDRPYTPPSTAQGPQPGFQWVKDAQGNTHYRQPQPGDVPTQRTGAGGRAVLSSDANRIAEINTSLDDVNVLEAEIGQTGAASKVGAMLPNVVTELTGWGSDAKQRQAVIDRVKQVIGKALEGGVLRKEDEYKYVKILPTIGDPPEVAKTKIAGLRAALEDRRTTLVEALTDAGYDTGRFSERTATGEPKVGDMKTFPNGKKGRWDGQGWEMVP